MRCIRSRPPALAALLLLASTAGAACGTRSDEGAPPEAVGEAPPPGEDARPPSPAPTPSSLRDAGPPDAAKPDARTCGGDDASLPRCKAHESCAAPGDCASNLCGSVGPAAGTCLSAPSCTGAAGTFSCGPTGKDDCCTSLPVPGGSYLRTRDPKFPATVSAFRLDAYEITVGRVRAYFEAMAGNLRSHAPPVGAGAHPKIPGSGWRASFDMRLPASWTEINDRLGVAGCTMGGDNTDGGAASWTPQAGPYEELPVTCLDWYTMFAFCAWDGGRLPTDAEWGFAAEGGSEQRWYPWGGAPDYLTWPEPHAVLTVFDPLDGTYKSTWGTPYRGTDPQTGKINDGPAHMSPPGRTPGYGRWGHADLTGNVLEFLLDRTPIPEGPCNDCARVDWPDPPQEQAGFYPPAWTSVPEPTYDDYPDGYRSLRGGSWADHPPQTWFRYDYRVQRTYSAIGARCARN